MQVSKDVCANLGSAHFRPAVADLTPLPIYQNAPLDETQVYQSDTKIGIFDPDPLPDHQIGLL